MTDIDTQAIRERCDAATPGPWIAKRFDPYRNRAAIYQTPEAQKVNPLRWQVTAICREARAQDADFIEHAREDVPVLLAEVERLRAALLAVEWAGGDIGDRDWDLCPWCGNYRPDGHRADCQRQLALGLQR
jgi:hypothetical protein